MPAYHRLRFAAGPLCLITAAAVYAPPVHAAVAPPAPPPLLIHDPAPAAVQSSLSAFQSACAAWPSHPRDGSSVSPQQSVTPTKEDARLLRACTEVNDPTQLLWSFGGIGAGITLAALLVGGFFFGLLRFLTFVIWEELEFRRRSRAGT